MKKILFLLLFPFAVAAQKYQIYPGEYDNWVRHPKSKMLYNVVVNPSEPVAGLPAIADGEGKGSASLHTAGFIGVDGFAYVWGDNACNISGLGLKNPSLGMTKTAIGNARQIVAYSNSGDGNGPGLGYGFAIVTDDNKLILLGNTQSGFRGDGTEGNKAEPAPYRVTAIRKPVKKIAVCSFMYVLYTDGTVDSWGGTRFKYWPTFVLGRGDNPDPTRPGAIKFPEPIEDLAGGGSWTFFKGRSGAIYGVGYYTRLLGVGPNVPGRNTPFVLTKVLGLPGNPTQLTVGTQASYALMANGDAYAWGDNTQAAVGNGQEGKFDNFAAPWGGNLLWVDKPVRINPPGVSFVKLFTGLGFAFYVVAEDSKGNLWSWGRNKYGVLWNGKNTGEPDIQASQPNKWDVLAPMKIDGFSRSTHSRQAGMMDTLVDAGGYNLHFAISRGKGIPILFEAGGERASTWNKIIRPVSLRTGTTLITYEREEAGDSTADSGSQGILNRVTGLEAGLKKLGYDGKIVLVTRARGKLTTELYTSRHPGEVKATVLAEDDVAATINAIVGAYNDASRGQ